MQDSVTVEHDELSFGYMFYVPCFRSGEEIILAIEQGQDLPDHGGNTKTRMAMERLSKRFVKVTVAIVTYTAITDLVPRKDHGN